MKICRYFLLLFLFFNFVSLAQTVPTPKEHFGFNIGDDYHLASYTQSEAYYLKVAAASNRVKVVEIGLTEEGRHQYMLIVSSPENLKKLDRYKEISQKLARAEGITPEAAKLLAKEGKPVIWIDGGLHATETVGAHQLIETYYQLVSRTDPETMAILDNVIILLSQVNPDGQELVSNWYMKDADEKKRNMKIPRLYQKYVGHDNNRDFYMNNMKETINISRQQYIEWMPQIIYNHHQTGPDGSVLAGPPYRDPFNHVFDPMIITGLDAVAAAMINRLNVEDKPGYTRLSGSNYSTWWNGGLRTAPYFHNQIGILTEIIGGPTPSKIPLVPERLIPDNSTPFPVTPQDWKFRQSIDYSVSLNYAVFDFARRSGDELLYNIYKMGKNAIDRGNTDHWTMLPKFSASVTSTYEADKKVVKKDTAAAKRDSLLAARSDEYGPGPGVPVKFFDAVYKDPALRDPRGYIISTKQPDFPTAVKFLNSLIKSGIQVHIATADFTVEGKSYPAGSYIVKTNQAFRPHVLDMFEPQDHPNDFQYPGGPPLKPYDVAGWTLAYQMGVKFDRILNGFDGPFTAIPYGELQKPKADKLADAKAGYILSSQNNDAFTTVNNLLKAKVPVSRINETSASAPAGSFFVGAKGKALLEKAALDYGIKVTAAKDRAVKTTPIAASRIALFDQYGGSMPSGWVRWLLEQNNFAFTVIYPKDIDSVDLHSKYDVILFMGAGIPAVTAKSADLAKRSRDPKASEIPAEFRPWLGYLTAEKSIPALKKFMEDGGSVVTVGSSTALAYHLKLPVHNALVEMNKGEEKPLPGDKYYIPGSILQVAVDTTNKANWGMGATADMVFSSSPVFRLDPDAALKGVNPLAWVSGKKALRSGWAWGISYLDGGVVSFEAKVGKGKLYAFGPEIIFRAQSHSTFKLLFNELYK
ncbi:M14 family metallopeptidase [Dyadobacter frigoris]|uniref:Peptidase n=1 Tax=Dyadobacter frigoris TaxID=2576211 RepID=A0A4U6CYH2_9BACT|nr:M14 metallopeptidase family protein [Dyadobacter frigoris]TKT89396.1 peptidase [Dyadobacter frigoris]GLU55464.1 peptidase [Dyadobacter frigoris]